MLTLGWKPYQNDHEDANGQFEMNWEYDDALLTADRHVFFKYMAQVDRREARPARDLHAEALQQPHRQWLPRPCLVLGQERQDEPVRRCEGRTGPVEARLSRSLGGILHNADALCSFFNPTVNSYKRINAPRTTFRAPPGRRTRITWTGNNRTHMIRVPGCRPLRAAPRRRCHQPLSAAGGYRSPAGLDGIANKRDPGKRLDINMYTEGHTAKDAKKLPLEPARRAAGAHRQVHGAQASGLGDETVVRLSSS